MTTPTAPPSPRPLPLVQPPSPALDSDPLHCEEFVAPPPLALLHPSTLPSASFTLVATAPSPLPPSVPTSDDRSVDAGGAVDAALPPTQGRSSTATTLSPLSTIPTQRCTSELIPDAAAPTAVAPASTLPPASLPAALPTAPSASTEVAAGAGTTPLGTLKPTHAPFMPPAHIAASAVASSTSSGPDVASAAVAPLPADLAPAPLGGAAASSTSVASSLYVQPLVNAAEAARERVTGIYEAYARVLAEFDRQRMQPWLVCAEAYLNREREREQVVTQKQEEMQLAVQRFFDLVNSLHRDDNGGAARGGMGRGGRAAAAAAEMAPVRGQRGVGAAPKGSGRSAGQRAGRGGAGVVKPAARR